MTDRTSVYWRRDLDSSDESPHWLPMYATVIFQFPGGRIAVRIEADGLRVTEQTGQRLVILPSAGNVVRIESS